jgi:probable addiction module antidote protein
MKTSTRPFDAAYLKNVEAFAAYMPEALETGDPAFFTDAISVIARARHDASRQRRGTFPRKPIRALPSDGNPEFATILKVVDTLGLKLTASASEASGMAA